MNQNNIDPRCVARHTGVYVADRDWLSQRVAMFRDGKLVARADKPTPVIFTQGTGETRAGTPVIDGNKTIISIVGAMMKGESKFDDTSNTLAIRRAIRQSVADPDVRGIMLRIDSPGGTHAGTAELADDIRAAATVKPTWAYFDDWAMSAALWAGSQAGQVWINAEGATGSIGSVAVVDDFSEKFAAEGITAHVISTGPLKGAGAKGAPVSAEYLAEVQALVNAAGDSFQAAVRKGRNLSEAKVRKMATGEVFRAAEAVERGLVDRIGSLDEALSEMDTEIRRFARNSRARAANRLAIAKVG